MKATAVLIMLVACGPGTSPTPPAPSPVANPEPRPVASATLEEQLLAELGFGSPVAVLPSPEGLIAISADGTRKQVLVTGEVTWALVDNRSGVVWMSDRTADGVRVLDLRAPPSHPLAVKSVIAGLPTSVEIGGPLPVIAYGSEDTLSLGHAIIPHWILRMDDPIRLAGMSFLLEEWGTLEAFQAEVAKARFVDLPLLKTLSERGRDRRLALSKNHFDEKGPRVTVDASKCEDQDFCGQTTVISGVKLWNVVVGHGCGDGCYFSYRLYDPAARRFIDEEWATWLGGGWVSSDGKAFVSDGRLVSFERGLVAGLAEGEYLGGGWLEGGHYCGADYGWLD